MPDYFHISSDKIPIGTGLKGKGAPHVQDEIEAVLESRRPADKLSRSEAVYMLDHTDFSKCGVPYEQGYVHVIEPSGVVQKLDGHWIGRMQRRNGPSY
jgi:hypothetical protein